MGIVYPSKAVARRWDGALQARLRRAPLEAFLRARSFAPAPAGISQDSDNLVRATVSLIEAALVLYFADREEELAFGQRALVGHAACLISLALAEEISRSDIWRVVALVSTARLLTPWIGLNAAAIVSASAARQFQKVALNAALPLDREIMNTARDAIGREGGQAVVSMSALIAALLNTANPGNDVWASENLPEVVESFRSNV